MTHPIKLQLDTKVVDILEDMPADCIAVVDKGAALPGLYPMNADTKARYLAQSQKQ